MRASSNFLAAAAAAAAALLLPSVAAQNSDPCAQAASQIQASMARQNSYALDADVAVACMKAFAWDARYQLNTTREVRRYMDYYSAGTYFQHNVCPELDLPTVNINATFDRIERDILAGNMTTYEANRAIFELFGSVKDGHVRFSPMCVAGAFVFQHQYPLLQIAETPASIPEIYVVAWDRAMRSPTVGPKVAKINGVDVVSYLTDLARSHPESAWIDPDARFNELLLHMTTSGWNGGLFAQRSSWPEDPITIEFANGTSVRVEWRASWSNSRRVSNSDGSLPFRDTDSFLTNVCTRSEQDIIDDLRNPRKRSLDGDGDDLRNLRKRSPDAAAADPAAVAAAVAAAWRSLHPRQSLQAISTTGGELFYYELDKQTAVLMLSAFAELSTDVKPPEFQTEFSRTAARAIEQAKKSGMKRLLIDVTYNGGGYLSLGHNLVRQLFPKNDDAFFGTNMRWNPVLDKCFTEGDQDFIAETYFSLGRQHKPDGSDWKDFREMLGPVHRDDDYFSNISVADENGTIEETGNIIFQGFSPDQPFAIEDVVLVSSGLCGSTCAVFAEALQIIGVKTVTVGGRPREGPMQGVGGIKGSQVLEFDEMAMMLANIALPIVKREPSFAFELPYPLSLRTRTASINFRNSWRNDGQYLPVEFLYTPAEFRMFYTSEMLRRGEALHEAARDIAWNGAREMSGGPYTPVMGFDGSKFKWPEGSSSRGAGKGAPGVAGHWENLGSLIWEKMHKDT